MSGGIVYDLWALAFAATIGGIAGLTYALRAKHHRPRPFDWVRDAPEYRRAKDAHVKVVP